MHVAGRVGELRSGNAHRVLAADTQAQLTLKILDESHFLDERLGGGLAPPCQSTAPDPPENGQVLELRTPKSLNANTGVYG